MKLALALLAASIAAPVAAPVARADAEPMDKVPCGFEGAVSVEVKLVQLGAEPAGQLTQIFEANGWLTAEIDKEGKRGHEERGCLRPAEVREVEAKLARAKWKITTARVHCMAVATTATQYRVKGKAVWTEKLCSGQTLDPDSAAAIDAVKALVAKARP